MVEVRRELPSDAAAIREVHTQAFGAPTEARLVELLRAAGKAAVSLVAVDARRLVGHVLFSPIAIAGAPPAFRGVGLAPIGILPERQRQGIGTTLVRAGLAACEREGYVAAVVLGEPGYYERFGFARARDYGLKNEYNALDAFMVIELQSGGLTNVSGLVKYASEFGQVGS